MPNNPEEERRHIWTAPVVGLAAFAGSIIGLVVTAEPMVSDREITEANTRFEEAKIDLTSAEVELAAKLAEDDISLEALSSGVREGVNIKNVVYAAEWEQRVEDLSDEKNSFTLNTKFVGLSVATGALALYLTAIAGTKKSNLIRDARKTVNRRFFELNQQS